MKHKVKLISSIKDFMENNWSTFTVKKSNRTRENKYKLFNKKYNLWKLIWIWVSWGLSQGHKNMNLKKANNIRSLFAMKYLKEISTETSMTNVDDPHKINCIKLFLDIKGKSIETNFLD